MRLSRFALYPWQVRHAQGGICHIADHGYGHLLNVLDPARTVVTVHDLIPLIRWHGGIRGVPTGRFPLLNHISFHALRRARHLIAISENTRRDLIHYCGVRPEAISVIYYGVGRIFRPFSDEERERSRRKWGVPENGTKRILLVGNQFYKNPAGALRIFARIKKMAVSPVELILIGEPDPEWERNVAALELSNGVRILHSIPHREMAEIYNVVDGLLFPSAYEGLGWPPMEAMACGTPVVSSNAASLPEVIGDVFDMFDLDDEEGMARELYRLITDEAKRESCREAGIRRARLFTWEEMARKTLEIYDQILQP
jgi:glycosyltransferase involved in cell wall biosynthesis